MHLSSKCAEFPEVNEFFGVLKAKNKILSGIYFFLILYCNILFNPLSVKLKSTRT